MNLPLAPTSDSRIFVSADPPGLVAWLKTQGFTPMGDGALVLGDEVITVADDGTVRLSGDGSERARQRLLLVCAEQ